MYELIPMKKFDFGNLKENVRRKVLKLIKQLVDISRKTPDFNLYLGNNKNHTIDAIKTNIKEILLKSCIISISCKTDVYNMLSI